MKYKGIELKIFDSNETIFFDPPKKMIVWFADAPEPHPDDVVCFVPGRYYPAVAMGGQFDYCAEIPEEPKPRRATNKELAKWLAQGNGLCTHCSGASVWTDSELDEDSLSDECNPDWRIRKWDDEEWHQPTADYMGLED